MSAGWLADYGHICKGWRRSTAGCRRMVTPGFLTCTYHRDQEETVQSLLAQYLRDLALEPKP